VKGGNVRYVYTYFYNKYLDKTIEGKVKTLRRFIQENPHHRVKYVKFVENYLTSKE